MIRAVVHIILIEALVLLRNRQVLPARNSGTCVRIAVVAVSIYPAGLHHTHLIEVVAVAADGLPAALFQGAVPGRVVPDHLTVALRLDPGVRRHGSVILHIYRLAAGVRRPAGRKCTRRGNHRKRTGCDQKFSKLFFHHIVSLRTRLYRPQRLWMHWLRSPPSSFGPDVCACAPHRTIFQSASYLCYNNSLSLMQMQFLFHEEY